MQLILGIYGAVLSTCLAILTIAKFLRERPKISVDARTVSMTASEGDDTHGVLVQVAHGDDTLWEEHDLKSGFAIPALRPVRSVMYLSKPRRLSTRYGPPDFQLCMTQT